MRNNYQHYLDEFDADDSPEFTEKSARKKRGKPRLEDDIAPSRRGRLTENERARIARVREDTDTLTPPENADAWSSWPNAAEHGPKPYPGWLITEAAATDTELGVLKTGKEADVHLVRRELPNTDRRVLLAAKRYRSNDHRLFHRDAGYLEGRSMRRSREMRAMANRTAFGRNLIAEQWAVAEFAALRTLWAADAPVPYPVQRDGTELLLEFVGDQGGNAAPRLAQLRPNSAQLRDLWYQLVDALLILVNNGVTHGDLSAYNILVHDNRLIIIDFPQLVDVIVNPNGREFLARDVRNICDWFAARGLPADIGDASELIALLTDTAGLG